MPEPVLRSRRSCAEDGSLSSTEVGSGLGLGGGAQSTAVWRGPYSHVTSESFNLYERNSEHVIEKKVYHESK